MKKKIICMIASAAVIVACLLGCFIDNDNNNIVITIGYVTNRSTIDEHIADFENKHPGVKIVPVEWSYDANTFATMADNNTLPGVYDTHFTEAQMLINEGYAADITQELKEYNLFNRINDFMMENISKDGRVYFIPRSIYSMGLYINVPLFKEAGLIDTDGKPIVPDSFEELRETAKQIKERTGKYGFMFPTIDRYGGWYFTTLAWNYGVSFMEKQDGKWKATFDTEECVKALQYIKDMRWEDGTIQPETNIGNLELLEMIGDNRAAITFAQKVQLDNAVEQGLIRLENIGLAKMPKGPAGRVSMVGGGYYGINPNYTGEKKRLAFEWLMYDKGYLLKSDQEKEDIENVYRERAEKMMV